MIYLGTFNHYTMNKPKRRLSPQQPTWKPANWTNRFITEFTKMIHVLIAAFRAVMTCRLTDRYIPKAESASQTLTNEPDNMALHFRRP